LVIIISAHHHPDEILDFLVNRLNTLSAQVEIPSLFLAVV